MAPSKSNLKRKASAAEDETEDTFLSDDDFGNDGLLEGVLEDESDDDDDSSVHSGELEDEDANGQEDAESVPTDDDDEEGNEKSAPKAELEDEDDGPGYTIEKDANGNERYVYPEIDPVYDSDDTDANEPVNTIGNIPLSFYGKHNEHLLYDHAYPHIGYDINGKKIMRPATTEALDTLLDSIEVPKGFTGLTDPNTGKPLTLSRDELELVRKLQMQDMPEDAYPDTVEWFTSFEEKMPLSAAPERKARFLPSKHEAKRVMKLVKAIREGKILPYKPPGENEDDGEEEIHYDLWKDEQPQPPNVMHIPAPKIAPPGYDLSYNPPPEYLPSEKEIQAWQETEPEEREKEYLPEKYDSLRKVPGYSTFVKERFERCLDLYLAPRVRKNRLNIDPSSLLPKLPSPSELKPYPSWAAVEYCGHEGRVRTVAIDPSGQWLASGGDDGTVRVFELKTGKHMGPQTAMFKLSSDEPVDVVRWRPGKDAFILAATVGEDIYLMVPPLAQPELHQASRDVLDAGFGYAANKQSTANGAKKDDTPGHWSRAPARLEEQGVLLKVTVRSPIKALNWHRGGNFFSTVSPSGQKSSVIIHTLSRHLSQRPFRKLAGLAQAAQFHPSRPLFFVATQRTIRCYDLQRQELVKVIQPGARWISSFDIHPSGDHLIVASYDRRLAWIDLDLSNRPFKTMRFHTEAIRSVRFHGSYPLFADASDDGSIQIMHGKVLNDSTQDATIIPIKMLRGHKVVNRLGVMDITWHPTEPWCASAGADGTVRLWA